MKTLTDFPILRTMRSRREAMARALCELEHAVARPLNGWSWTEETRAAIEKFGRALEDHIQGAEEPGGLFDDVLARAPRLAHSVDHLRREHTELRGAVEGCRTRSTDVADRPELRRLVTELMTKLSRHRQGGSDLIWETFEVDIGAMD